MNCTIELDAYSIEKLLNGGALHYYINFNAQDHQIIIKKTPNAVSNLNKLLDPKSINITDICVLNEMLKSWE